MAPRCFSCAWTRVDGSDEEDGRFYDCEEEFREEKEEEEDGDEDGDDARETLTRVGAAMEYESRGGSYVSRVRAHARALAAMASIIARGRRVDLTSFLGTPIRWCARNSVLRVVTDSRSSASEDAPPRTIRFFDALRRVDARASARDRMAAIVLAVLSDNEPPASLRKPLNPVLGETATHSVVFEATGERFVSVWEQVSHHPPVSAHCTEGANVRVEGQLLPRPHLVGAHIEVELVGSARITLLDAEDEVYEYDLPAFEWRFVPRWEARMKRRTKWRVACERTGYIAEYAYGSKRTVRGHIFNAEGVAECDIYGRYDGKIVVARSTSGDVIARYDLNDPTAFKGNIVRHTRLDDARDTEVVWRECFRAMEDKRWDDARRAKRAVEERERRARRERELHGEVFVPRFFERVPGSSPARWRQDPRARDAVSC